VGFARYIPVPRPAGGAVAPCKSAIPADLCDQYCKPVMRIDLAVLVGLRLFLDPCVAP